MSGMTDAEKTDAKATNNNMLIILAILLVLVAIFGPVFCKEKDGQPENTVKTQEQAD